MNKKEVEKFYDLTAHIPTSIVIYRFGSNEMRDHLQKLYRREWPQAVYQRVRYGPRYEWMLSLDPVVYMSDNIDYPTSKASGVMDQLLETDKVVVSLIPWLHELDQLRRSCYEFFAMFPILLQQQILCCPEDYKALISIQSLLAKKFFLVDLTEYSSIEELKKYLDS